MSNIRSWCTTHHSYYSFQIIIYFIITYTSFATILYNDGQTHIQSTSLNEAISLRSSSTLTLPSGDYTIRSPSGNDSAIRLYMSSNLNATGGDIIGGDVEVPYWYTEYYTSVRSTFPIDRLSIVRKAYLRVYT